MQSIPFFVEIDGTIYNLNQITYFYQFKRTSGIAVGITFAGNPNGDVVIDYPKSEFVWKHLQSVLNPHKILTSAE
jgi:hypothetical protein